MIEVIISISVLLVLVTALFGTQQLSPPPDSSNLQEVGENLLDAISNSGKLWEYYEDANYSYYTLDLRVFDSLNETKLDIINSIKSSIPLIANFKAFTYRFNPSTSSWDFIDTINFEAYTPSGSQITFVELYTPGFKGNFEQFKIQLSLWYEVQA